MRKILLATILILIASVLLPGQDVFQKELFSADLVLKYRNEIDLTEKQAATIKNIYNEGISEFNSLKWDLDAELTTMNNLLQPTQVDNPASLQQMDKILSLENKLKKMKFSMMLDIKNELTEAQQDKLNELKSESDISSFNIVTPINENPRVMVKIDGGKAQGEPLYFIKRKNKIEQVSSLLHLEPSDIKSMEVLKGEAAVAEYGPRAKNGAIIVQLKNP